MNDKRIIGLAILFVMLAGCRSETAPFVPQQIDAITDEKELLQIMFRQSVKRIPKGQLNALIQRNFLGTFELVSPPPSNVSNVSDKCRATADCLGVLYAGASQTDQEQTKILYRIYQRETSLMTSCAWLETYGLNLSDQNDELVRQVNVRALEWVKTCFAKLSAPN